MTSRATLVVLSLILLRGVAAAPVAAAALQLKSSALTVSFVPGTGQIASCADGGGTGWLAVSVDQYDLAAKTSTEASDVVSATKPGPNSLTFECANRDLGLRITKTYSLRGRVLIKQARYLATGAEKSLLRVSSLSRLDPALYQDGYYYTTIDDGYKVRTVPYLPSSDVTLTSPWTISTGQLVFYSPRRDALLAHYRYKVQGDYCYGEAEGIRSEYVPGGAVTALGQEFIGGRSDRGDETALTLESHYLLTPGDPRAFHRHLAGQPPHTLYRNAPVPDWMKHVRLFLIDGMGGSGRGLMEQTDAVIRDVQSFLKVTPQDEHVAIFFNHWSTSGYYPSQGDFSYYLYNPAEWSKPASTAQLKEKIRALKSLSPRVKVGGYFYFAPATGTPPYEQHKDWFLYGPDGAMTMGGDGISTTGVPDFSTGYREYMLDQLQRCVTDLGFDWLHLDSNVTEAPNYRTQRVMQSREMAQFYTRLSQFCVQHNAAIVQNVAWTAGLWAQGAYFECQQPDRWEDKDWRILAGTGFHNALYRGNVPGAWVNLVYGCHGAYGLRNAYSGMRGWIRNAMTYWDYVGMSLAREQVVDELLATQLADIEVAPSWWKLQTDKLETLALRQDSGLIIPIVLHGTQASEEEITLRRADLKLAPQALLFAMDVRLPPAVRADPFRPMPWTSPVSQLAGFRALASVPAEYRHRLSLQPRTNIYHLLTQTPGWVYSCGERRTALLLPENRGVTIQGTVAAQATGYRLSVTNSHAAARILAHVPQAWASASATIGGKPVAGTLLKLGGERCLLLPVGPGRSEIVVAAARQAATVTPYEDPPSLAWSEAAARLVCEGVTVRAYPEQGQSCLELTGAGTVAFWHYPHVEAGGFSLKVQGQGTGGTLGLTLNAGGEWSAEIKDDFTGWKQFDFTREQLSPPAAAPKWDTTRGLVLRPRQAAGKTLCVADVHLLPARPGDFPAPVVARKRVVAQRVATPPLRNGNLTQACWQSAPVLTNFYAISSPAISESKTNVRVCYDADHLYVAFENLEPLDTLGARQPRDTAIWNSNHIELYLDPTRDGTRYTQLLVDPAGTIEDLQVLPTGRSEAWNGEYDVKTYLNWKASWVAEYAIPFKTIGQTPQPGAVWGINFARKDGAGTWSNWATSKEWLDPANFGEIQFGGESAAAARLPRPTDDPDILLYAGFDGATTAQVQRGAGEAKTSPQVEYTPGHRGQALVTSHERYVLYPGKDNVQLAAGTVSLWVKPMNWHVNQQLFHHFVTIQGNVANPPPGKKPFSLLLYKFRDWDFILAYGMQQWLEPLDLFSVDMDDTWTPGRWHHIAFTWDAKQQTLWVDGKASTRPYKDTPPDLLDAQVIKVGGPYFLGNEALTALDELRVYRRALSLAELGLLYQE